MKVLILGDSPWDNSNSYGNTLSNWFEDWTDTEFYHVYCRSSLPNNKVCQHYYTVPPLNLIKNIFHPNKVGCRFDSSSINRLVEAAEKERTLINKAQQGKREWMYVITDLAYSTCIWRTRKYKKFIQEANPDIVFSFGIADAFIYENYCYIKKHTHAKIITFIADDVNGVYEDCTSVRNFFRKYRFRKIMKMSDLVYGASTLLCDEYKKKFGIEVTPLYKGCNLASLKVKNNNPLKIVYAGNLFWGRSDVLGCIAKALKYINKDSIKATLEIYTGSFLPPEIENVLNCGDSSKIMGKRSYDEIIVILHNADIVLHVESFDPQMVKLVKYSFSTKIIDCLQSGSSMLVIGPAGIASVEQPRQIPGAYVIDNIQDIPDMLCKIIEAPLNISNNAKLIQDYARTYFSIKSVRKKIFNDFSSLIKTNTFCAGVT